MKNYQKQRYETYYLMLSDGSSIKTTRKECFAPAEPVTQDNPYPQRWYYSPDGHMAIRLPRNELGETTGKQNAADLKSESRTAERKNLCIGQTSHAKCTITCERCSFKEYCDSEYRVKNGFGCKRKCDCCSLYVRRTLEIDKPLGYNDDGTEVFFELADEDENIENSYVKQERQAEIAKVIGSLEASDQELWLCLVQKVKKEDIADRLHMTVDGVYYRQKRLERKLRENETLKKYF